MTTSTPRRRWFPYSLRTMLVLMLLACIGMGWFAVKMQRIRKEQEAVAAIEGLGGSVSWAFPDFPKESRGRAWLRKLLGERFAIRPDFAEIRNDAAMEYLRELTHIPNLVLIGRQFTDAGLAHLKGLTQLQSLDLSGTQVTDAGLEHIKELTQLQWLSLESTQVTDAGMEHLKGLSQLEELDLTNTQVSDSGVSSLQQALPNCRISR
ncbi:MAG: leucine-rich repeat domain-containing protein [Pirellulaceae bacterium]